MDGRRRDRLPKANAGIPKTVPLASYGIKIYGREYRKWPTRYEDIFRRIIGSTCACSTEETLHSKYREALQALGYDTELPSTTDGRESYVENIQQARDIQRRAINLYRQSFSDRDSGGPSEDQWRLAIEELVLGRFDRYLLRDIGISRMTPCSRRESITRELPAVNNCESPTSTSGVAGNGVGFFGATSQQEVTSNPFGALNGSFSTKECPGLPPRTRSSSYCSTSLNELQQQRHFASATGRFVLEDDLGVDAPQPDQKPDRIIGLVPRNSIYAHTYGSQRVDDIYHQHVRDLKLIRDLNLSPFSNGDFGSVILPFAVCEAKSAQGTYWPALEKQTAFPVAKFLRLQIKLQEATGLSPSECNTLVWMFGSIGSTWQVYGCYAIWYNREKEWRFKIVQLASMDIRVEKEALQLLNIVDVVLVWAQSYRQRVIDDIQKLGDVIDLDRE